MILVLDNYDSFTTPWSTLRDASPRQEKDRQ